VSLAIVSETAKSLLASWLTLIVYELGVALAEVVTVKNLSLDSWLVLELKIELEVVTFRVLEISISEDNLELTVLHAEERVSYFDFLS
jgi:hypothetical protein